jgi:hypothetical protein
MSDLLEELFARQSDRNMPKSKFNVGITGGKLMAKEYEGVLLLLASQAQDARYYRIPISTNEIRLPTGYSVETLLGWVQWLKSEKMQVKHVDASSGNIDISVLGQKLSVGPKVWG